MNTIPITDSQLFFIMWHSLLGGAGLCYHFDINGPLNIKKLEKSINHVVSSHPSLLSSLSLFEKVKSFADIKLMTRNREELKLSVRHVSQEKAKDEITKEHLRLLNKKTNLQVWPLLEFTLFKFNKHSFHFFMGIDHVISDGLSSLEILHQIFSSYHNRPIPSQSVSAYHDLVYRLNQFDPDPKSLESTAKFLEDTSNKPLYWNPLKKQMKQDPPFFHTESYVFTQQETNHILQATKTLRNSIYPILIAAYLEVINTITPSKQIELTLPTSGRIYPEVDLQNTVGCFAQALTLSCYEKLLKMPFRAKVSFIEKKIQQGLIRYVDKVLTKKIGDLIKQVYKLSDGKPSEFSKTLFQSSMKSNLYISFTGQSPLRKQYGNLTLDHYEEGTFNHLFAIDFMHSIFDQKLHIFANYNPPFFEKNFVQEIMQKMRLCLKENCFGKGQDQPSLQEKTPTDKEIYKQLQTLIFKQSSLHLTKKHILDDLEACHGFDSLAKIRLVASICRAFDHEINKEQLIQSRNMHELAQAIKIGKAILTTN